MSCSLLGCHVVRKDGSRCELDHDKATTTPGTAFYYCSVHRVYHCVEPRPHRRQPQPPCGECAWLFFRFPSEAAKYPGSDVSAPVAGPTEGDDVDVAMASGWDDGGGSPASGRDDPSSAGGSATAGQDPLSVLAEIIDHLDDRVRIWKRGRRHRSSAAGGSE
ncbi:hypothetical protein F4820DRAFT_447313 [Hypoxylon rubiginosum]|uniref:Uncharacterized protein n=1 Tax=Hypoxylon rubiginosum TaxID=110542 RepID=A0ACB9Z490_9PEZI|nr:hypothetical protein F4820DRAFT_447313 [Hypoxylon rubiginosum]